MAKKKGTGASKEGRGPSLIIETFTDSAERIGVDAALYGMLGAGGLAALAAGAAAWAVVSITLGLAGVWIVTKYVNAHLTVMKEKNELDRLRLERGRTLLNNHRQHRVQPKLLSSGQVAGGDDV